MTLGVIDVGTNSIHLLIGLCGLNGRFHVILKERDLTRLGEGGLVKDLLTQPAMKRAMNVLGRYTLILERCRVEHVEAVATSAVRDAANGREFVERVRSRLGIPLRIISGREEARLIYLGVMQEHRFQQPVAIVTVGGGSSQVVRAHTSQLHYVASVPLGGHRLAQRFIAHDPPRPEEVQQMQAYVRRTWAPVVRAMRRHRFSHAVGTSATIRDLMLASHLQSHEHPPRKNELGIRREALDRLVDRLAVSTVADRIQLPGIDPRREDLLLPVGMVLQAWMEGCRVGLLQYASGSLREGLVVDYLIRHHEERVKVTDPLAEFFNGNGQRRDVAVPWKVRR